MKKRNILGCSLIIISFCLLCIEIATNYEIEEKNEALIENYFEIIPVKETEEQYLGILEIPNIHLKRGFYSYHSNLNTVETNIEVINPNCLPNENCNFILASHSGSSNISFFKHLNLLNIGDTAILTYQKKETSYTLNKKESIIKNGSIALPKTDKKSLILTTCNKENDNLQDIYYFS